MEHIFVIITGMTLYIAAHVASHDALAYRPRWRTAGLVLTLGLASLVVVATSKQVAPGSLRALKVPLYVWVGLLFYLTAVLGTLDAVRAWRMLRRRPAAAADDGAPTVDRAAQVDPDRRAMLANAVAGTVAAGAGGLGLIGGWRAWEIERPEVVVALEKWPRALSGLRIAHLSDLHIGAVLGREFLTDVVEATNALRPDLVVVTGDLVDSPPAVIARELEPLGRLRARFGTYVTTGNHEYYAGGAAWIPVFERLGLRPLVNRRVTVGDPGAHGASFDLAGIPDTEAGVFVPGHTPSVDEALASRDPDRPLVMLAHRPSQIADVNGRGVDLQLSGHTHGGQLLPFGLVAMLAEPYLAGLHRHPDGTRIYVTRGTGFVGPAMRVLAPAEIPLVVMA